MKLFAFPAVAHAMGVNLAGDLVQLKFPPIDVTGLTDLRFVPTSCVGSLRTLSGGALTTAAAFKIGSDAAHANIAPIFTIPINAVPDVIVAIPLSATRKAINLLTDTVFLEVSTGAVGPSAIVGDILLLGTLVKTGGWE